MARYEQSDGKVPDDLRERVREALNRPQDFIVSVSRQWALQALVAHDAIVEAIFEMRWTVAKAAARRYFVSSDHPAFPYVAPAHQRPMEGPGFRTPHVEVTLPLSPRTVWMGHWKSHRPRNDVFSVEQTKAMNRRTTAHAERFVLAHIRDSGIQALVDKHRDHRPRRGLVLPGAQGTSKVEVRRGRD
jgi:hypothetical protein